jgi:formate hydrogenlyase subunit 3/multisubunit Na+/H+ antiporter MnhD subunit
MLLPLLTLAITLPLLGIWPCQGWHRRLHVAAPVWAPVLATLLGLFLLLRLLLDLAGPAGSPPCGLVLILLGLAGAVQAGAAALFGTRLRPAIGRLLSVSSGLSLAGIGICYLARAEDLPVLAGTALDAVLLLMPAQVLAGLGALVLGQAMETEAGASTLRRLGGLAQSMPRASLLAGVAVLLLGFLPPAGVFAGLWLLLQATLTASRLGGGWLSGLMPVGIVVVMVLSAGLCLTGWLRLASVGILGRPRTPRGAAALDIQPLLVRALCCLFALPGLIGLFPGLWLHAMAPLRQLLDPGVDGADFSVFRLVSPGNTAGLSPLPLVLLATLVLGVAGRARRRLLPVGAVRHAPAWEGGAPPPPPWLPFGDPAAQIGPATLPRALVAALGGDAWPDWMTKPATAPTRRRLRRSIGATRAASLRLSLMLRSHAGLPVLVLLASVLAVAGWWQAP